RPRPPRPALLPRVRGLMALCPFAVLRLIPPGSNDPRISPRVAVLHVDAGDNPSLYDYFRTRSGGIESHFHIRRDGLIEQYRDTDFEADANHKANPFADRKSTRLNSSHVKISYAV